MSDLVYGLAIIFLLLWNLGLSHRVKILESFVDAVQVYVGSMERWYSTSEKWYQNALKESKLMDEHFELVKAQYANVMELYNRTMKKTGGKRKWHGSLSAKRQSLKSWKRVVTR